MELKVTYVFDYPLILVRWGGITAKILNYYSFNELNCQISIQKLFYLVIKINFVITNDIN